MKTPIKLMCGTGAILIAISSAPAENTVNTSDNNDARPSHQRSIRTAIKTSDFIGLKVENYQGQKLGKVEDLAVNLDVGRVVQVIVSRGGFAGLDTTLVAVPLSALNYDLANSVLRLDATPERFQEAPAVDISKWSDANDSNQVAAACAYFNTSELEARVNDNDSGDLRATEKRHKDKMSERNSAETAALFAPGAIKRESKLIGDIVENNDAQTIGRVENFILDLPSSKIVAVVVSPSETIGTGAELNSYPPSAFRFRDDNEHLILTVPESTVSAQNNSYNSSAPAAGNPAMITPLDQGNNQSDINITAQIRRDILADHSMSVAAQNIQIITIKGHVVLGGAVDSQTEKQHIYTIATSVAAPGNVSNQLIVAPNAHTVMNN